MTGLRDKPILPRERWFWAGLAVLLILAGWFYLRGYNASLPFIVHHDEPHHLLAAQHTIDFGHARGVFHEAYPPGTKTLAYLILKHIKPVEAHHGKMLPALRLITIGAWLLVVAIIALLGHKVAHPLTGLMAATIWIVNPWVVERARWFLPDAYLTLFTLLAIWLGLVGALHGRRSFSTAAVYSIMLAIVFKTQALFVAPLVILLPLASPPPPVINCNIRWQQIFWNGARFGFFLFWLLLIYPTLEVDSIVYFPTSYSSIALPNPESAWTSLRNVLQTFQPDREWLYILALGALSLRYRQHINWIALGIVGLTGLAWLVGMSMFQVQNRRHYFFVGAVVALLYGCSLTMLFYVGREALTRIPTFVLSRIRRLLMTSGLAALAALFIMMLLPSYQQSDALAHNFTLPDRRNDLMHYMDTSLEPAKFITDRSEETPPSVRGDLRKWLGRDREWGNHKTFNRAWGGYDGAHDFPVAQTVFDLHKEPLEVWRAHGAEYAIMPHWRMLKDPDIYFPEQTVLLKTYPASDQYRGPDMVVLRLQPMQNEHGGRLGSLRLLGYDISATTAKPGDDIILRHYWRADAATDATMHVFNHLLDDAGEIVAQVDGMPLYDNRRDSTSWDDPDEILLGRNFILRLPADLPPASYRLVSGIYDPSTGARLPNRDGSGDSLLLTEIEVIDSR